jgi:hypothetical protein
LASPTQLATSTQPLWPSSVAAESGGAKSAVAGGWARALTPSFTDGFVVAMIAWLFVCGANGWKSLLADGDAGWHIRTGEYIVAHHAVPRHDLFSFSKPDAPWFAWEWLSDVAFAGLFHMGGLKAITLFAAVLIAIYAAVLLRQAIWLGADGLTAAVLTLLAVGASAIHFLARPHLFTLVFLPACMWLVQADSRRPTRWLWALIPFSVLWTNLHGGFFIFLALLGMVILGNAVEACLGRPRWPAVFRYCALAAGCALASLVNPYGTELHRHVIEYLRSDWIRDTIQEFQAPTFRSEEQLQYEALLIAGLILAGFLLRQKRVADALCVLFLAHSSLMSVRHAPLYAAVAMPLVAAAVSSGWKTWAERLPKKSAVRILGQMASDVTPAFRRSTVWPLLVLLALALVDAPLKWPRDFPSEMFPIELVRQNAELLQSGRLLTTDQWGDYMIFHFYPREKVFVDGRSDFYGQEIGTEYLHLLHTNYDWRAVLDRYRFQVALLPVELPITTMLKRDPDWRVIGDDHRAVVLARIGLQTSVN